MTSNLNNIIYYDKKRMIKVFDIINAFYIDFE